MIRENVLGCHLGWIGRDSVYRKVAAKNRAIPVAAEFLVNILSLSDVATKSCIPIHFSTSALRCLAYLLTQCLRDHLKHKLITVHGSAWLYRVYASSIGFAMHLLRPVPATAIAAYLVELNIQFWLESTRSSRVCQLITLATDDHCIIISYAWRNDCEVSLTHLFY